MMLPLLIRPVLERSNLFLAVHRPQKKVSFLLDFLRRHQHEAGIIYCSEHRLTEHLAQLLNRSGFLTLAYHKGLTQAERAAKLQMFHAGGQILVATPDPSFELELRDIRFVVHYTIPESLDQYYQEIDHAGRDGLPAKCILLANAQDLRLHKVRFSQAALRFGKTPAAALEVQRQLESMLHYAFTHQCLRAFLLDYFRHVPALFSDDAACSVNASTSAPAFAPLFHNERQDANRPPLNSTQTEGLFPYELITLPPRNRVLTSKELPADESLQSIRQYGRHPKNRIEKVSMQLKRAEKQHVFIRYADREFMMNRAYKYEHLRKDPWDLAVPGLRIQRFRPISIPRDTCCINCNPELLMEKERYGVNDILERKERVKAQIALDQTDTSVLRKEQLWNASEEIYHFEDAVKKRKPGRIMAERTVEYTKILPSPAACRISPSSHQGAQKTEFPNVLQRKEALPTATSVSSLGQMMQRTKLLEDARREMSAEMRTQLLGNLKALRQKLATDQGVPVCTVFSNRTLVELCRLLPLTREECAQVYGVGAWKLAHYSDAFLSEIRNALHPHYVAEVYENVSVEIAQSQHSAKKLGGDGSISAEISRVSGYATGTISAESAIRDAASAMGMNHSTALRPLLAPAAVIHQDSELPSESQYSRRLHFAPEAEMVAFLEEKYLQTRTKKRIVKKEEFYLTAEEAATFACPDGLRAPELAQRLNALVAESKQEQHKLAYAQAAYAAQRGQGAARETDKTVRRNRKKLSGTAIERKLAELGYLECCEYTLAGRLRTLYLPGTRGAAVGIGRRTKRSAHGLEYPVAVFSIDAARWVATLFVREA